jgi:hypothetical protein
VSDFGFGVAREVLLLGEDDSGAAQRGELLGTDEECMIVPDRNVSRSLATLLPKDLKPGRYRVRVDFCRVPFPQMPQTVTSNVIEVSATKQQ